jgi:glycerophosphoryl diester phosphodiesterase
VPTIAGLFLVVLSSLVAAAPADAVPDSKLLGHRCRLYDPPVTNEDTVAALRHVAKGAPGAWCEIDAWRISDGTVIVFHDLTWRRVADRSTLPSGVAPTDKVTKATWAQVSKIRTKGGQPIPKLHTMIDASARHHVPLLVEVKNFMPHPHRHVIYAKRKGATVSYYREPGASCGTSRLDRLQKAGARIGIKLSTATACTPAQLQARHVSFVTQLYWIATAQYDQRLSKVGVAVYARGTNRNTSAATLANGAAKLLCPDPAVARSWPGT